MARGTSSYHRPALRRARYAGAALLAAVIFILLLGFIGLVAYGALITGNLELLGRTGGAFLVWCGCGLTFYVAVWRRAAGRYYSQRQLDHGWVYSSRNE